MEHIKVKKECGVCPTKIWGYNGIKMKKTEEYNEVEVKLNTLSNLTVGVCSKHLKLTKKDFPKLNVKMHQGWLEEVALGIGHEEWVKNEGLQLKVVGV